MGGIMGLVTNLKTDPNASVMLHSQSPAMQGNTGGGQDIAFSDYLLVAHVMRRAMGRLRRWAIKSDQSAYRALIEAAFGTSALSASDSLRQTLRSGPFQINVLLLDGITLQGIRAGYTATGLDGREAILINRDWLNSATSKDIEAVLLEEVGHALDHRLNGDQDARGDEGEIFSALLRGTAVASTAANEDDHHTITVNGQLITVEAAATAQWTRLGGGVLDDFGTATTVAVDGSVYMAGFQETVGTALFDGWELPEVGARENLYGTTYATSEGVIRHYDTNGTILWAVPISDTGTAGKSKINGMAAATDGSIVVVGSTTIGSSSSVTAFVRRLNSTNGATLWHRNLGPLSAGGAPTFNSEATDLAIASDGSITVCGRTGGQMSTDLVSGGTDIFLARYQLDGSLTWIRQYGSSGTDAAFGVTVASDGSAYVAGVTYGLLEGQPSNIVGGLIGAHDGFISRFDTTGSRQWTRVISASGFSSAGSQIEDLALAADGSLYAVGRTKGGVLQGQTASGATDGILARFTADGLSTWTRLIQGTGTNPTTMAQSVAAGLDGMIYVSGHTSSTSLDGQASSGGIDGFVSQFDSSGNRNWSQLIGTSGEDRARSVALAGSSLYVTGASEGNLGGQTNAALGNRDAYLSKLDTGTSALLPPLVTNLTVAGTLLTLVLDKVLSGTLPDIARFSLLVNGTPRSITAVSVDAAARNVILTLASPVLFGEVVSLNYTDSTQANDTSGVIQDAAGIDLMSFPAPRSVTNVSDGTAPSISSITVNGNSLTITLNELLSSIVPDAARFSINVNGTPRAINAVSSNPTARTVTLTLATAVSSLDNVTVSYTDTTINNDATGVIEDAAGNDLASTSAPISAINQTPAADITAPQIISQQINGNLLTLTLDETLGTTAPDLARFTVLVNGLSRGITSVSLVATGRTVTLQLATAVNTNDVVSLSYTDKSASNDLTGVIEDVAGNDLATVNGLPVLNTTAPQDTTPPTITNLSINGSLLNITLSEALAASLPDLARFSVSINGFTTGIASVVFALNNQIQLQLTTSALSGDNVLFNYTDATPLNDNIGVIQDIAGNDMLSVSSLPVINLTPPAAGPSLSNVSVSGSVLSLQFAPGLASTQPDVARFNVLVNGAIQTILSALASTATNSVSLTLASAPNPTDLVTVSYTDKTLANDLTGVIETAAGIDLGTFTNRPADTYISPLNVLALNAIYKTLNLTGSAAITGIANSNNNTISGNGAANTLNGGSGSDTLLGNLGNDILLGGDGDDLLDGGIGTDTASYLTSTAAVRVDLSVIGSQNTLGAGADELKAIENLTGSSFNDVLTGNLGNNVIDGGLGADQMSGGLGNDTYVVDNPGDIVVEFFNQGTDLVQSSITFVLDLNGTEHLTLTGTSAINGDGNTLNNTITGNIARNILNGLAGNDVLNAGAGNDDLFGGIGNDVLNGGAGNDLIDGGPGVDTASYAGMTAGVNVNLAILGIQATGGGGSDTLTNIENLTGSSFNDSLSGDGLANILTGGAGQDTLNGGGGNDVLIGGAGRDLLTGGLGTNTFRFALTDSLLATMDIITDLVIGVDQIDGPTAVSAANLVEIAASVATLDQIGIAAKLTAATFPAFGAATFTYAPAGSSVRTFLALNDATAGFDSLHDAIIELNPYFGVLTSLSVV